MKWLAFLCMLRLLYCPTASAAESENPLHSLKGHPIRVAFVLSEGTETIDFVGPWEVFQDSNKPFELYTVAKSRAPIHTSGSGRPGFLVTPEYSFSDAPKPDIVVIGGQQGGPEIAGWLKKMHADHAVIASVCVGAYWLAQAGLLDGKLATTHHLRLQNLERAYPNVKVVQSVRYVQSDPTIFTSSGLTSGMDLAFHIVAEIYGDDVAQRTADYMEYQGTGWKTSAGAEAQVIPRPSDIEDWSGNIDANTPIVVHIVSKDGESAVATTDSPNEGVYGLATQAHFSDERVTFSIRSGAVTIDLTRSADGKSWVGTVDQDKSSTPISMTRTPRDD